MGLKHTHGTPFDDGYTEIRGASLLVGRELSDIFRAIYESVVMRKTAWSDRKNRIIVSLFATVAPAKYNDMGFP